MILLPLFFPYIPPSHYRSSPSLNPITIGPHLTTLLPHPTILHPLIPSLQPIPHPTTVHPHFTLPLPTILYPITNPSYHPTHWRIQGGGGGGGCHLPYPSPIFFPTPSFFPHAIFPSGTDMLDCCPCFTPSHTHLITLHPITHPPYHPSPYYTPTLSPFTLLLTHLIIPTTHPNTHPPYNLHCTTQQPWRQFIIFDGGVYVQQNGIKFLVLTPMVNNDTS